MLSIQDGLFYLLAVGALFSGMSVILLQNPIYSALSLAVAMISIAAIFYTLGAFFIAAVQVIVYAGAVMVLFVMVLMLFDLKHEMKTFSRGMISGAFKIASAGLILGLIMGAAVLTGGSLLQTPMLDSGKSMEATKALSHVLFTDYIFEFEAIGILLLIIAVGTVTLSRISGGTHAD